MCIILADKANFYDRIKHVVMALIYLALGVPIGTIAGMLLTIQMMKFFLWTS